MTSRLLPDGKTLVVANGGIDKRHDDTGGRELADIRSDLVYLDWQSERLLERAVLESQYTRLSIRHLALTEAGDVAAALQDSADVPDLDFPLGFLHRPGSAPRWLAAPDGGWASLRGYCGAAAVDRECRPDRHELAARQLRRPVGRKRRGAGSARDPRRLRPQRDRHAG